MYETRRRYGLEILNYTVTSNHIHLLVARGNERDIIPNSIKLIAGRTGQEFNQRKGRIGAFWEDCYHATAIENGEHLFQCLIYIDLNIVRAGVVKHPSEWLFCGYNEIQKPKRKNILINYQKLTNLFGFDSYDELKIYHKRWVEDYLENGKNIQDDKWTKYIAVGSETFIERIQGLMGVKARGRKSIETGDSHQLREPLVPYNSLSRGKKEDKGPGNT